MLLSKYEETIEHLKTRWQHTDRNFLRQLFPLLADGRSISLTHLTEITHKDIAIISHIGSDGLPAPIKTHNPQKGRICAT